jgi:Zn-finger nucleic acid-binding protein
MIDACPECRGVWLDRGELDRILVKERQVAAGARDDDDFLDEVEGRGGRRAERPQEGRPEKRRRRRSLLEDLFEFD